MGPVDIARVYLRLGQLASAGPAVYGVSRDLRDRLAARIGTRSGRTLDRYLKVLSLPRPVQDAVSRGALGLTRALALVRLPRAEREEIADEFSADGTRGRLWRSMSTRRRHRSSRPTRTTSVCWSV
jgi:hypothetical protein